MLYAMLLAGQLQRVVDSATDLNRMPVDMVKMLCRDMRVPYRTVYGEVVQILPIRPRDVRAWEPKP